MNRGTTHAHLSNSIAWTLSIALVCVAVAGCGRSKLSQSVPKGETISAITDNRIQRPEGACDLPWGGFVEDKKSVDAFDVATLTCSDSNGARQYCKANNSPHYQLRTCNNGVLSGDASRFKLGTCNELGCQSCSATAAGTSFILDHGVGLKFYPQDTVACGSTCQADQFTCNNGTLKDAANTPWSAAAYPVVSCQVTPCGCTAPDPVTGNPISYSHGATLDFWDHKAPLCGDNCNSHKVSLSCQNGKWGLPGVAVPTPATPVTVPADAIQALDGKLYYNKCSAIACRSCTLPWPPATQISDYRSAGTQQITAYAQSAPACPTACQGTQLKCSDGTFVRLDGSTYAGNGMNKSCACQCPITVKKMVTSPGPNPSPSPTPILVNIPSTAGSNTYNFWTKSAFACGDVASGFQIVSTCNATSGISSTGPQPLPPAANWFDFGSTGQPPTSTACSCTSLMSGDPTPTYPHAPTTKINFYTKPSVTCGRTNSCESAAVKIGFFCNSGIWQPETAGNTTSMSTTWAKTCNDVACASCPTIPLMDYGTSPSPTPSYPIGPVVRYSAGTPICPGTSANAHVRCNNGTPENDSNGSWVTNSNVYSLPSPTPCQCSVATADQAAVVFPSPTPKSFYNTTTVACGDTIANHTYSVTCTATGPVASPTPLPSPVYANLPQTSACTCTLENTHPAINTSGLAYKVTNGTCLSDCAANSTNYRCLRDGTNNTLFQADSTGAATTSSALLPAVYSRPGCTPASNCQCATPWGETINVGVSRTAFTSSATSCGIPCDTVSTPVQCQLGMDGLAHLMDVSNPASPSTLDVSKFKYGGCLVSACAGAGGGGGGGEGTGAGRGRGDEDLLPPGAGGGGPSPPSGCDLLPTSNGVVTYPVGVPSNLPTVSQIELDGGSFIAKCRIPWANQPPVGLENFSLGGDLTTGILVFAFTSSTVAGTQTCDSVRVPVYCDHRGVLHAPSGSLYNKCTSSRSAP